MAGHIRLMMCVAECSSSVGPANVIITSSHAQPELNSYLSIKLTRFIRLSVDVVGAAHCTINCLLISWRMLEQARPNRGASFFACVDQYAWQLQASLSSQVAEWMGHLFA
jgi:hypothetical protein